MTKTCPVPASQPLRDRQPRLCSRCQREDAAERAAIHHEGKPATAWQRALAHIQKQRQPGQRELLAG